MIATILQYTDWVSIALSVAGTVLLSYRGETAKGRFAVFSCYLISNMLMLFSFAYKHIYPFALLQLFFLVLSIIGLYRLYRSKTKVIVQAMTDKDVQIRSLQERVQYLEDQLVIRDSRF